MSILDLASSTTAGTKIEHTFAEHPSIVNLPKVSWLPLFSPKDDDAPLDSNRLLGDVQVLGLRHTSFDPLEYLRYLGKYH